MELTDTERIVLEELHDGIGDDGSMEYRLRGVADVQLTLERLREKGLAGFIGSQRMRVWHLTEKGKELFG